MSLLTASVVLYKTPESQLARLLGCIAQSSVRLTTYLVDNSPAPTHPPSLKESDVIYVRAPRNGGYGAGHNIALRKILNSSEFHFVLNPDIYFESTALQTMIEFMRQNPSVGQLMPKVIYPDGRLQYLCKLLPRPSDLFLRRFAVGPLRRSARRAMEQFELRHSNYDKIMDVPYLSGCFMLFRTSSLRRIGLFDERFFMYPEDIDITRRMHAEFRTVFFPGATIVHDHARESYKSASALWVHLYNLAKYFNKWGWAWDSERERVNRATLRQFESTPGER